MTTLPSFIAAFDEFMKTNHKGMVEYETEEGNVIFCGSKTFISISKIKPKRSFAPVGTLLDYIDSLNICFHGLGHLTNQEEVIPRLVAKTPIHSEPVKLTPIEEALSKRGTRSGLEYLLYNNSSGVTDEDIVGYIRAHPDEVKFKYAGGDISLIQACSCKKSINVVRALIECGVDVNACTVNDQNALHYAVVTFAPNLELISELIKAGIDLDKKDKYGNAPICHAVVRSKEAVELLVTSGADVNVLNDFGSTVLFGADNIEAFKYLLNLNKIDLYHRNNQGRNVLDYFLGVYDKAEYCRLLIERNVGPTFNKLTFSELERYLKLVKP